MRLPNFFMILLALCLCGAAIADDMKEGRDLYKAGKFKEAAAKFEQVTKSDPKSAKAHWQLNFAYAKLNRFDDALKAAKKAGELDPSHKFASDSKKFDETIKRLEAKVRKSPAKPKAKP